MKYLNSRDMEKVILTSVLSGTFEQILKEKVIRDSLDKEFYKFMKYATTYALKALDIYMNNISDKEKQRVMKQVKSRELMICYKGEHLNQIRDTLELEQVKIVDIKDLNTLLDLCSASCSVCDMDHKDCEYFEMLRELGAEPLKTDVEEGDCCYRY